MRKRNGRPVQTPAGLRAQWREKIPEIRRLVEDVAPRAFEAAAEDRLEKVPEEWKALVQKMRDDVHASAADWRKQYPDSTETLAEERGYQWHFKIGRLDDMLDYLMREIRRDIGFEDGDATLASMLLVSKAFLALNIELQHGGKKGSRDDGDEYSYRVLNALKALTPRFDDIVLRRFRALQTAESMAKFARPLMNPEELDAHVEKMKDLLPEREPDEHRDWVNVDKPVLEGVFARSQLAEVDERFGTLDPMEVYEEFAEAQAATKGGKSDGGEGKVGPARAVARLAVRCGALDYEQGADEDFDAAVERARGNLLQARHRIRKELRGFPGMLPEDPL
jgi:hypothetical protein